MNTQPTKACILKDTVAATTFPKHCNMHITPCSSQLHMHQKPRWNVENGENTDLIGFIIVNIILFFPFCIKVCSRTDCSLRTYTLRLKYHPQSSFSPYQSRTETRTDIKWEGQSKTMPKKTITYTIQKPRFRQVQQYTEDKSSIAAVQWNWFRKVKMCVMVQVQNQKLSEPIPVWNSVKDFVVYEVILHFGQSQYHNRISMEEKSVCKLWLYSS